MTFVRLAGVLPEKSVIFAEFQGVPDGPEFAQST